MAWTITSEVNKAALDAITDLLDGGSIKLTTSADAELAVVGLGTPSFAAASTATPSVAAIGTTTADQTVTEGTIGKALFITSGAATRMTGVVTTTAVGTGDVLLDDTVIPTGATSVDFSSFSLSLQLG